MRNRNLCTINEDYEFSGMRSGRDGVKDRFYKASTHDVNLLNVTAVSRDNSVPYLFNRIITRRGGTTIALSHNPESVIAAGLLYTAPLKN